MPIMTPSEALIAYGVDCVFGIIGSAILDPVDLFDTAGIRFVGVQHEPLVSGHRATESVQPIETAGVLANLVW